MKRLLRNSLLFLLPLAVLIYLLNPDTRYRYKEIKDDCLSKGIWMFDRIHHNDRPMDIIFMGSSHTINAIDDVFLNDTLAGSNQTCVNFGYCRLGRNIQHSLLKEILSNKKPSKLVLEIRTNENPASHPIYPYITTSQDVVSSVRKFNPEYLSDAWIHGSYKIQLTQDKLFDQGDSLHIFPWDHGLKVAPDTINREELKVASAKRSSKWSNASPRSYIKAIAGLCDERGIELVFLYLPNYAEHTQKASLQQFYEQYGEVWYPPKAILKNEHLWFDKEHLNQAGARKLSKWLTTKLDSN